MENIALKRENIFRKIIFSLIAMSLFKKKASESASPAASPAAPRPAAAAHSSTATSAGHHVSSPAHATTSSSSTTSANEKHSSTSHPPNTTSATSTAHTIATTTAKSTAASTTQPTTTNPAPEKKKPSMAMSIDGEATEANNSKAADHDGDDGATTPTASRSPSPSRRVQLGVASKVVEENKAKYKLTDFRLLETLGGFIISFYPFIMINNRNGHLWTSFAMQTQKHRRVLCHENAQKDGSRTLKTSRTHQLGEGDSLPN
jgi:hypothetical protein